MGFLPTRSDQRPASKLASALVRPKLTRKDKIAVRDPMPKSASARRGRIVRSSPTIAPTKAFTRTSKPNCCQLALRPSWTDGGCSRFCVAISGDCTAICSGFQIGWVSFRPAPLLIESNDLLMVRRGRGNASQNPLHEVVHRQLQLCDPLLDFR